MIWANIASTLEGAAGAGSPAALLLPLEENSNPDIDGTSQNVLSVMKIGVFKSVN